MCDASAVCRRPRVAECVGRAADEKPAAPAKGYELRIVTHGDTYNGIRFKPTTGESWKILNGRWEKLDEAAAPPAGDYDITLIPAEVLLAVRIDRATGTTWLLTKGEVEPGEGAGREAGRARGEAPGPGSRCGTSRRRPVTRRPVPHQDRRDVAP